MNTDYMNYIKPELLVLIPALIFVGYCLKTSTAVADKLIPAVLAAVGSDLDPEINNNAMNFQAGLWNVCVWNYLPKTIGGKFCARRGLSTPTSA